MRPTARILGALALAAALAAPALAAAQTPAPPTTAPVKGAKVDEGKPQVAAPAVASPPTPSQGSTAVPGWNNPPKSWEATSEKPQYASIPGRETNVLIQAEGRKWRAFHNGPLVTYGGWLVVVVFLLLILVYLVMGKIRLAEPPTGRLIERFNAVERASHWTMAICFVFLAVTGAFMLWGKYLVLPWLGYKGFALATIAFKNIHNFVGPLFMFSLVVSFLVFVGDNFWKARDTQWMLHVTAMFKHKEVPSGRFNGGEKLWFWGGLVFMGLFVSVTGLILDFPNWNQGREAMQYANMIHAIAAVCFIAGSFLHVYIGTIGMEGAYQGMRRGYVDEEWAREHHLLWYEDVKAGRRPERIAPAGAQPATGD